MAVVRNLMIRVGADFSAARKGLQGATRELTKFGRDTDRTVRSVTGRSGLGRISAEFTDVRRSISASLSQLRGARGIGGVVAALGSLRPAASGAAASLRGLGAAAGGASAALGPAGLAAGVLTAALAAATVGIYRASQAAVQYEADLGRLQMQLGANTRGFVDWARSLGLARQSAVQMGATYSTLLSSFIRDNDELDASTRQLLQTTRVVASATGRSIEDVMERMRSGLLGNTEAIEDLGIFVNVSMIESTNAFRRFAGDKSWDQLTFQQQQQIRLAAILEQAYARYGDKLQNNVMTKQERLMEQLKDIKLNLSQAFLPIWDAVLPALTRLAESIAYVTEELARFVYWLRGWDYDERTRGAIDYSKGLDRVGDSYDDVADSARAARKELAAFDRLNLIGGDGAGGTGGTGGGTGGTPMPPGGGPGEGWELPPLPTLPRLQLQFDLPTPPDAGIGAVATAVTATVESLTAEVRAKWQQLLADMQSQVVTYAPAIQGAYAVMSAGIRATHEADAAATRAAWQNALAGMQADVAAARPPVQSEWYQIRYAARLTVDTVTDVAAVWKQRLNEMLSSLKAARPQFESDWYLIRYAARLTVQTVTDVAAAWAQKLGDMLDKLNIMRPLIESGWWLIRNAIRLTVPALTDTQAAWQTAMQAMASAVASMASTVSKAVGQALDAISRLKSAFSFDIKLPSISSVLSSADSFEKTFQNLFGGQNIQAGLDTLKKEWEKPENQAGLTIMGLLSGGGTLAKGVQAGVKGLAELLKGFGIAVPAFAAGGVVSGPTLAMVGEYPGARTNPEVIAPLSDLESMIDSSRTNDLLARILRAIERGQNVTVSISRNEVGQAAASYINDEARRGRNPLPAL